jgi:GWxTD domain-containing protein
MMGTTERWNIILIALAILLPCPTISASQEQPSGASREKAIRDSIRKFDAGGSPYKAWLQEDVVWIITDEERKSFKLLDDAERDQFIEAFWMRRDPTPDTFENEFKQEHYRRIVYAQRSFRHERCWVEERSRTYVHHVGST